VAQAVALGELSGKKGHLSPLEPLLKEPNGPTYIAPLLLNDDHTPMEFVVHVLDRFFNRDHEAAHRIMMHVHQRGIGECGVLLRGRRNQSDAGYVHLGQSSASCIHDNCSKKFASCSNPRLR